MESLTAPEGTCPLTRGASLVSRTPQAAPRRGRHAQPARRSRRVAAVAERPRPELKAREKEVTGLLRKALREEQSDLLEDVAYREGEAFLRALGIQSKPELAKVLDVAMNPNSLFVSVLDQRQAFNPHARVLRREELEAVRDFLEAEGLTREEIAQVVLAHPPVLCYSVPGRMAPLFALLRELGIAAPARTVARRPLLLGLEADSARRIAEYLREEGGKTPAEVEELLATSI